LKPYSAHVETTLLEIYPLAKGQKKADDALRLGFAIEHFPDVIEELVRLQTPFHQGQRRRNGE
jgi:hypothetical protein